MSVVESDDLTARRELMQTLRMFLLMSDNRWMKQIPVRWDPLRIFQWWSLTCRNFGCFEESDDRKFSSLRAKPLAQDNEVNETLRAIFRRRGFKLFTTESGVARDLGYTCSVVNGGLLLTTAP